MILWVDYLPVQTHRPYTNLALSCILYPNDYNIFSLKKCKHRKTICNLKIIISTKSRTTIDCVLEMPLMLKYNYETLPCIFEK